MAITFLKNCDGSRRIATDRIVEVRPKKNGNHSGGEFLAYFGVHRFCGIGGVWVLGCIPPSPYQIFYEIFLNLTHYFSTYKGFKILKSDKIQTFQIDYLSHFLIKYVQCEENSFFRFFNATIVRKIFENS